MLDPKFEYNGRTFSLETINAKAQTKGLSTEDYLKQNPEIKKIEDSDFQNPTTPGAVVEETAAPDTDSKSENGFLVPQEDKVNYGESYKSYEENRNSKTRIDFLLNSKVDPYAPALTDKIARLKIKSSILDDDFQPGRQINIDQEKYSSIIQKAINSDNYLNDLSSDILKFNKASTDKILNDVKKEFDLTTEEGVKNANEEYVKRINAFLSNKISSNKTYEDRINKFQNALDAELDERNVKYNRERLGLDEKTYFGEFLKSGFKDITLAIKKGNTANIGENIIKLKKEREAIENSRDDAEVSYGGTFSQKEGFKIGTKRGSKKEALKYYDQEITDAKSKFLANLKGIQQREIDLSFYKQLPKDVDYFSKDGLGLIAKQIPQLGFAAFTGGLGVYMQEFGSAYFENVYNSLGDKPATAENILKAVEEGNGERGLATTQAVISSLLESYGAAQIVRGVLGSAGGKSIVRSIVKDGLKKYVKSGGLKEGGKGVLKGGFTEYLTEGFQTLVSQLGAGAAQDDIFKYIDLNNVIKSAQDGGFVGAILPFAGNVTRATARETVQTVKEISSKFDPKRITPILSNTKKELEIKVKNNEITREEADETIQAINNIEDANLKIPTYIKNESRIEAVDLIVEKQKILNNIKTLDENFLEADTSRLEEINNRLVQINKEGEAKKLDEKIKKLEKPIKEPGSLMADPLGVITAADKIRQVKLEEAKQQKISNEVQNIYNEKGVEGAFEIIEKFKPIVKNLVDKRRDSPNFDRELLTSEIEIGLLSDKPDPNTGEYKQRSILGLIREYGSYVEKQKAAKKPIAPLSGFINKQLPKRMIEASNKILGEQFTEDVTEIRESRIELDDATQENLDFVRTEPKAKEQLRDVAGITKEAAQADAKQILKGKLPGILEKTGRDKNQILTEINKASKLKIADAVLEEMGGNFTDKQEQKSQFITFMDTNFDAVINAIPNASKNKLPLFEPQQVRRETTTEGDAAGKGVFEYKDVSRDEFIKYYTEIDPTKNPASEMNKLRAKKKGLADILAQEIGKDAIAEVLQDPQIQKEFLERQKLLKKEIPQDAIPKLLERIDRAIEGLQKEGNKFKGITAIGVSPKLITDSLVGGLKIIKKGLKAGLSFQKALAKGIDYIKRKLKSEAAGDVIGAEIQTIEDLKKLTDKQLQKVMEDVQEAIDTEVELGKQNKAYFKDLKSLNIKETLDLSRLKFNINESKLDKIKSNRLIKGTPKEKQDFINKGKEVVSAMPKQGKELFIDGKNTTLLQGLVGFHYRYVGSGQAPILYDNISTKQPAWISDKTKELFKNLPKKIVTANDLKSVQIAINEAKTQEEKIQIAKNNLDKIKQHQKDVDAVFYAVQSLLSDYVYSAKNEQDLINKIDYVTKIKSTNSNNVNGDRALVKVNGFYIGPIGKKVKLEHVKTSAEQSIQGLQQILSGNMDLNITSDFEGVYGFEFDNKGKSTFGFSKIDKAGKTNVSQYYRFNDPKDAANYILAEYNFEGSIANKNVLKIHNDVKKDKVRNENIKEIYNKKDLNTQFNEFLEKSTGIGAEKVFNQAKAEARAKKVRKSFGDYFIPPGAEDFGGLMHKTLAKGKIGEQQLEFYKKNLYEPYNVAIENITREKAALMNDFMALKKKFSNVPKKLKKLTKGGDYTNDQAVRVFVWTKQGMEIPGISKKDIKDLINEVKNDKELSNFASELINITKGDGYPKAENSWMGGNVAIDLMSLLNGDKRSRHLEVWQNNVDQIFSKENMFKLEAAFGKSWVKNVKATLDRMKTGSNRKWGGDKNLQAWQDWVNGSVGTIMFLNTRSAALQMISNVNYINYKDNNPLRAAQAFANQKQYWTDFVEIFNSDYLQERRGGNKININESELALAAEKGGVQGTISYLLNKGFILTKMADSFAIASGGATMYRNRIKTYIKDGMSEADAKKQAFLDFKAITEETQQSSRPDRISEQQAGNLGRFMLAFANTPMQYNRIIKRNAQDLFARRGDPKEKMSKILYYSTIQNFIFNAMSKAVFALAFSDDDDDEKVVSKAAEVGEGMAESLLRGSGLTGNAVVAVKNVVKELAKQSGKPNPKFEDVVLKGFTVSPPLYGKVTRLRGAGYALKYVTPENIFEPKLDNPALSAAAQTASATFNFPLDRALRKAQNIEAAMSNEPEWWQRAALLAGWGSWELGMEQETKKPKKISKTLRKNILKRNNNKLRKLR